MPLRLTGGPADLGRPRGGVRWELVGWPAELESDGRW